MNDNRPTHLDLFSGIGGFTIAAERAGFRTVAFSETQPYPCKILKQWWPAIPNLGNAQNIKQKSIKGPVNLITGGDPCQAHSNSCRTVESRQPSLGAIFIRIVGEFMPQLVVRENPSVVRKESEWDWRRFCLALEQLGYYTLPIRARACCFGADIKRERLFVLAALPEPERARLERYEREILANAVQWGPDTDSSRSDRRNTTPRICGKSDGIPNRSQRIKAIGNAVHPKVAEFILNVMRTIYEDPKQI